MTTVTPLDPDSPTAKRFLDTLADIQIAINNRKRAAQLRDDQPAAVVGERYRRKAA
jgi:hypothetical protein